MEKLHTLACSPLSLASSSDDSEEMARKVPDESQYGPPENTADVTSNTKLQKVQKPETQNHDLLDARAYQIEMFELSLKKNIIVAMPTGSGKTQIAVLRIQAEVERSASEKISWLMTPTVALCEQQYAVLKQQIPAVSTKLLTGDTVKTWSDGKNWNAFLHGARVVVSTYQMLLDAISHAFIPFERLSLIVFDEAHNCRGNSSVAKLMQRYHERKASNLPVPSILGLTASPIMTSRLNGLEEIERNLDAVCQTPAIHREELAKMTALPEMLCCTYVAPPQPLPTPMHSRSMPGLLLVAREAEANLFGDPAVLRLAAINTERNRARLESILKKKDTYTIKQLQSFYRKSEEICRELGDWAADLYIAKSIHDFQDKVHGPSILTDHLNDKSHVSQLLERVQVTRRAPKPFRYSDKVDALVRQLLACPSGTTGIVFVEQTATVTMLARILSMVPALKDRYRVGTMVGTSSFGKKSQGLGDLFKRRDLSNLEGFKCGTINLLVATSVLEEGIDIPACNLVVCFDPPKNLKSFIQRRGRARKGVSQLILLIDDSDEDGQRKHSDWLALEQEMKRRYTDEQREVQELVDLDSLEAPDIEPLRIGSSGARLDFDEAKSHLQHVCTQLSTRKDTESTPYYVYHKTEPSKTQPAQITATVVLPTSLPAELRRFRSARVWYSEKNASKDAALVAFKALYNSGLVNDNLMPLREELDIIAMKDYDSMVQAKECYRPWLDMAQAWRAEIPPACVRREMRLFDKEGVLTYKVEVSLPAYFPAVPKFSLYLAHDSVWAVECGEIMPGHTSAEDLSPALLHAAFGHRFKIMPLQHIVHVRVPSLEDEDICLSDTRQDATTEMVLGPEGRNFLMRDNYGSPFSFLEFLPSMPDVSTLQGRARYYATDYADGPWLVLKKWPKQQEFFHPLKSENLAASKRPTMRPLAICMQDKVPIVAVRLGIFLPSILHMMQTRLIAHKLSSELLVNTGLSDVSMIVTAISASSAHGISNYQRLEFLGDAILKFMTTISLSANWPTYPEGYLTAMKSNIVSNAHLCTVSLRVGLDEFIITEPFAGRKWRPSYVDDLLSTSSDDGSEPKTRLLSTKTLADVVESLMGAAYLTGGWPCTARYLQKVLPEIIWHGPEEARTTLKAFRPMSKQLSPLLQPLEDLCGYTFENKAILTEAMTHTSFSAFDDPVVCRSLERLEFLGDAVLDTIVVEHLWKTQGKKDQKPLPHQQMHLLRTAAVNADLLGFLSMEWCIVQEEASISPHDPACVVNGLRRVPFWQFMRHSNPALALKYQVAEWRYKQDREKIRAALQTGHVYPWKDLAHMQVPKTFSDIVESLLGAVWVDSGSLDECAAVAEKIGILPLLRRLVEDAVDVLHPKNKLGEFIKDKKLKYEVDLVVPTYKSGHQNQEKGHDETGDGTIGTPPTTSTTPPDDEQVVTTNILDETVIDGSSPKRKRTAHTPTSANSTTSSAEASDIDMDDEQSLHYFSSSVDSSPDPDFPAAVRAELSRIRAAGEYTCKVYVDQELIIETGGGLSREEIVTKAADAAYQVLLKRWGPGGPPAASKTAGETTTEAQDAEDICV